jgi:hypothetical protein
MSEIMPLVEFSVFIAGSSGDEICMILGRRILDNAMSSSVDCTGTIERVKET